MEKWVSASPAESAAAVAVRAVGGRLTAVRRWLKQVRQSPDEPRHVHQLRVWCRRAEAALDLFAPLFPARRTKRLRARVKKLRRAAGDVRDLDVLAPRPVAVTGEPVPRKHRKQRAAAMAELLEHTTRRDGRRVKRRSDRFLARVKASDERFGNFARERLRTIADAFVAADPSPAAGAEALHAFRIRGKALRYAVESGRGPGPAVGKAYTLSEPSETLGTANDLATFRAAPRWADRATDPAAVSRLRRQSATLHAELLASQDQFRRTWTPAARQALQSQLAEPIPQPRRRTDGDDERGPGAAMDGRGLEPAADRDGPRTPHADE